MIITRAEIHRRFTYHPPDAEQIAKFGIIRDEAKAFAERMAAYCPDSRELSLAMTKLEEAVMWANAAIAREGA